MNHFVLPLGSSEATVEVAGGKGGNLSQLMLAGFPVPVGFVLTMSAYTAFVQADGIEGRIAELSRSASADDPVSFETASRAIQSLFDSASIPQSITMAIRQAYGNLYHFVGDSPAPLSDDMQCVSAPPDPASNLPVAVRSSATAEDLPEASFAGQQDTYLNVRGEEALLEAIKRCWASLWNARAMAYRARQGIDPAAVRLAVVVQPMVPADVAGVLFTVNPLTGNRDEVVINAAWGLGEAVVSGRVTPDTVLADKATGRVSHLEVGDKAVMTVLTARGTAEAPVDVQLRLEPVLTPEQIKELTRLSREIEGHFGSPQDIEWAIASGRLYILQSRPVTALPEVPLPPIDGKPTIPGDDDWPALGLGTPQPFDLWTQANVGEVWPHPVTPLTWSGIPEALNTAARYSMPGLDRYLDRIQWTGRFYGRIYYNEGALAHLFSQKLGLPGSLLDAALGSRRRVDSRLDGEKFHIFRFMRALPCFLRSTVRQLRAGRQLEALFPQIDPWVTDFVERNLDRLNDHELGAELAVWREHATRVLNLHNVVSGSAMMAFAQLERRIARWCGRKDLAHDLITGLTGVFTAEMGASLWQIAQRLQELGLAGVVLDNDSEEALAQLRRRPEARPVIQMLDAFLRRHGHRCPHEGEWLHPRWVEAPERIIEVVAGYLRAGEEFDPIVTEDRQRRRREEAVAWMEAQLGPLRRVLFRLDLARAQHLVRLRENGRHYLMKVMLPLCLGNRVYGRRWSGRGWLKQPEDLFFLAVSEIEAILEAGNPTAAGLDLLALVAERRKAFEYWFGVEAPEVLGADGQPATGSLPDEPMGAVLHGIAASGGRVRGTARLIRDPRGATRLQKGDILVTRATDTGWTPVFPLVGGLVLEVGGQLSHGAIVAREYGVPAVVNVHEAMRRIQDGQMLTVDGTAGCVYLDNGNFGSHRKVRRHADSDHH